MHPARCRQLQHKASGRWTTGWKMKMAVWMGGNSRVQIHRVGVETQAADTVNRSTVDTQSQSKTTIRDCMYVCFVCICHVWCVCECTHMLFIWVFACVCVCVEHVVVYYSRCKRMYMCFYGHFWAWIAVFCEYKQKRSVSRVMCLCVYERKCIKACRVCRVSVFLFVSVSDWESVDSLSLESCSESGLTGVGSLHERLKLLARRSAKADGVRGEESHSHAHTHTF